MINFALVCTQPTSACWWTYPPSPPTTPSSPHSATGMDLLLHGCYTRFLGSRIKWNSVLANITILPFFPLYPTHSPPPGLKNWPTWNGNNFSPVIISTYIIYPLVCRVSNSILFWASKGADGISFLGLEGYATDR